MNFQEFINLPGAQAESNSSMTVSYRARSADDYGTLLCFASNSIGHQDTPCASHIIPSGINFSAFFIHFHHFHKTSLGCAPSSFSYPLYLMIIPSFPGPPDPVEDCMTGEPDPFVITILCQPAYDGGLTQTFTAEFYTNPDHTTLQSTVTNNSPRFSLYNLPPGTR